MPLKSAMVTLRKYAVVLVPPTVVTFVIFFGQATYAVLRLGNVARMARPVWVKVAIGQDAVLKGKMQKYVVENTAAAQKIHVVVNHHATAKKRVNHMNVMKKHLNVVTIPITTHVGPVDAWFQDQTQMILGYQILRITTICQNPQPYGGVAIQWNFGIILLYIDC